MTNQNNSMLKKKIIIAIDGHSSSGKSSFARAIAAELGYIYIDSGAMYRAVALFALQRGLVGAGMVDAAKLIVLLPQINIEFRQNPYSNHNETWLNGANVEREIRQMQVSQCVSMVSAIAEVRCMLVRRQQALGAGRGIVMDGRDIGTAVFPDAELKIFLTASPAVRAQRRYEELIAHGSAADYHEIEKNIIERDYIDEHRSVSPLCRAADAIMLDNSAMTQQQQMAWFKNKLEELF
jgi:cytidylate kinase